MATTPSAQQIAITNLYVALFNRAPDAEGLNFWSQALVNGASLATITQGFLASPEAAVIYPASQTSEQFISAFYQTVFGRAPDAEGLNFWVNALDAAGGAASTAGRATLVEQISAIVSTPLPTKPDNLSDAAYAQTVADRSIFANKVVVGTYFALDTSGTDLNIAKQALAAVTPNASSVDAGKLIADGASSGGGEVVTGQTYTLQDTNETLVGTASNDTFNATHLTLNELDSIDGRGGIDTLNYVDSSASGVAPPPANVRGVEIINIQNLNAASAPLTVDARNFVGATTFNAKDSAALITFTDLADNQSVGMIGNNAAPLMANYADGVTTATINFLGNAGNLNTGALLLGNSLGSARITSTGSANTALLLGIAPTVTDLRIDAATDLLFGYGIFSGDFSTTPSFESLETVTVTGAAANVTLGIIGSTVLTSVDASALSGGLTAVIIGSAATIKGGQGNDTILIGAGVGPIPFPAGPVEEAFSGSVDAGGGTANVIGFARGEALADGGTFTGFQILQVSADQADQSYDTTLINGITSYRVTASPNTVTLASLAATAAAVTVTGPVKGLVLEFAAATDDHVVNLTLDNTAWIGGGLSAQVDSLTIGGVQTLNIQSSGLVTGVGETNRVSIANSVDHTTLSQVVITGNQPLVLNLGDLSAGVDLSIDASAASGFLDLQGADALQALTIQAGTGGSTIAGGVFGDLITLAAGNSADTIVYTSAQQSLLDLVNAAGTSGSAQDEIVNFVAGVDKIDLSLTNARIGREFISKVISATSDIAEGSNFYENSGSNYRVVAATLGADTYLVVDADGSGVFEEANDLVVKLTGVTTLALSDLLIETFNPV